MYNILSYIYVHLLVLISYRITQSTGMDNLNLTNLVLTCIGLTGSLSSAVAIAITLRTGRSGIASRERHVMLIFSEESSVALWPIQPDIQ